MELINTIHAEMNDTACQVVQDCLRTPEILRQVLLQFSNSDLLKLSLVNKQWNFEARSVLKARGNLVARIAKEETCKNLVAFASDIQSMRVVPFSGAQVYLSHSSACQSSCKGSLDPSYNVILERLPWKQLDVNFTPNWRNNPDCPAIAFIKKTLDSFSDVIEKLTLNLREDTVDWFENNLKNWSFSHLKTLVLHADGTEDSFGNFVKAVVPRAPHLQELLFCGCLDLKENVLEGSSAVLVPDYEFSPLHKKFCASLIGALRPERIEIYWDATADLDLELFNGFIPKVLQASCTSLKTLRMDLIFAVPLMCYGICLENVTTLEIRVNGLILQCLQKSISTLLKGFDFTRVFPRLKQVRIVNDTETDEHDAAFVHPLLRWFSPGDMSAFLEQGNALLKRKLPDRAINIKQLTLNASFWEISIPLWAQMFPHVKALSMDTDGTLVELLFIDILQCFANLEELNVTYDARRPQAVDLDTTLCGISSAELSELRRKDDEYLRAVHVVPIRPSITCMRDLRSFTCRYTPKECWDIKKDSTFMFSKVTALLGFARCPSLAVTFETNSNIAEALRHMEPYVTLIVKD